MSRNTIHTLNARDNVLLEVARDYFNVSPARMHQEIQQSHNQVVRLLASKGIAYSELRGALVPNAKKLEIALFFDRGSFGDGEDYGHAVHQQLLPLLPRRSSHSVLDGDYIGSNENQQALFDAFVEQISLNRDFTFRYSNELFVVYINNLTERMSEIIRTGLSGYPPYVGFANVTFASRLKHYLSTILPVAYLKHKSIMLMEHEPDVPNDENHNLRSYPLSDFNYEYRSLQDHIFGLFLDYKIERPAMYGGHVDTELSLNAIHAQPSPLEHLDIVVDERKFGYLAENKAGSLKRVGLSQDSAGLEQLKSMLREKIASNYIYNLTIDPQHGLSMFNILLEAHPEDFPPARFLASLKYDAVTRQLHLVTLF